MNTVHFFRCLTKVHSLSLSIMKVLYHQNANITKAGSIAVFKHNVTVTVHNGLIRSDPPFALHRSKISYEYTIFFIQNLENYIVQGVEMYKESYNILLGNIKFYYKKWIFMSGINNFEHQYKYQHTKTNKMPYTILSTDYMQQ